MYINENSASRALPVVDNGELKRGRPVSTVPPNQQYPVHPFGHAASAFSEKQHQSHCRSAPGLKLHGARPERSDQGLRRVAPRAR